MKKGLIIFGIILISAFTVYSQQSDVQKLFRQGNAFFQQGRYQQAIEQYRKIVELGYESGELYYNLGNAYFKINDLGRARLYYERARMFMPDDEALKENLALLQRRLIDKIDKPPRFFLSEWWDALLGLFSMTVWTYLVVGLFWLFIFSWAFRLYMLKQKRQNRGGALVTLTFVLFLFVAIVLFDKAYRFEKIKYGVILKPSVTVYSEPRAQATEIFVLHEGTKVRILRNNQEWLEIKLEDGKTGWLQKQSLEVI